MILKFCQTYDAFFPFISGLKSLCLLIYVIDMILQSNYFWHSIAGMVGRNGTAYMASKRGLRLLTKDLAVELAKDNIRINSLHPGGVLTPMTEDMIKVSGIKEMIKSMSPQGRIADPIELVNAALFLASAESSFMTGAELVVDGGAIAR